MMPFLSIMPADVASSGMVATGATADVYRGTYSQSTDVALRLAGPTPTLRLKTKLTFDV